MSFIITLLVMLVVLGLVYWLLTLLPLPEPFPMLIKVLMVLSLIYVLLSTFGILPSAAHLKF